MTDKPLLDVGDAQWAIIQHILQTHIPEREVWAFGSRAKWTAKEFSDLDLAVIGQEPLQLNVTAALADDFSESDLPWKVDVVDWATTSPSFRQIIERDKVVVQKPSKERGGWGMSSNAVRLLRIGDFAQVKGGKRMPAGTALVAAKTRHPYLRIVDFKEGSIEKSNLQYVPDEAYPSIARYIIDSNDLYISIVGTIGLVGKVPLELSGANLTENAAKICQIDSTVINRDYLGYFLRSEIGQAAISSMTVGSTQPKLALFRIEQIEVPCPSLDIQESIVSVLNALDDRITLLRETNTTLEAIAQSLFKSWFVDFDPVHAKMQGRAPEGMDEATASLFPDSFEESELGAVPKGWSISSVADVAEIIKGKSYSSKDLVDQHTTALVTLKSFERGGGFRMDGFKPYSGAFKPSQVVTSGDLIVAYTDVTQAAELIGKPAIVVGIEEHDTLVASLDVGIVRPDFSKCGRQFLYGLFKTDSFQSHTLSHTSGTTVLHLSKDGAGSYRFALPPVALVNVFQQIATELTERKQTNTDQARTLASLRDVLLPRLISGQLNIENGKACKS